MLHDLMKIIRFSVLLIEHQFLWSKAIVKVL